MILQIGRYIYNFCEDKPMHEWDWSARIKNTTIQLLAMHVLSKYLEVPQPLRVLSLPVMRMFILTYTYVTIQEKYLKDLINLISLIASFNLCKRMGLSTQQTLVLHGITSCAAVVTPCITFSMNALSKKVAEYIESATKPKYPFPYPFYDRQRRSFLSFL